MLKQKLLSLLKNTPGARKAKKPDIISPQLCTLGEAPSGDEWIHEIKFDGYRLIAFIDKNSVHLMTRRNQDWTEKFSSIAKALKSFPVKDAILDGEVVVLDKEGISRFQLLQNVLEFAEHQQLVYFLFDILYCTGFDLTGCTLAARKQILDQLLDLWKKRPATIRFSEHILGKGEIVLKRGCQQGLEGIISKLITGTYQQRRSRDWIKSKCMLRQEFIVGGYTEPSGARNYFGSLLLGYYNKASELIYCGHVGTGFNEKSLKHVYQLLHRLEQKESPFSPVPREKNVHWVKPKLVVEVNFFEWTQDGILRVPSFQGIRRDKNPREITEETLEITPAINAVERKKHGKK